MRFGFHVSIAGGFARVTARALELGCETMQLFTRNPRGWKPKPVDSDDAGRFRKDVKDAGISPVFVHAPYLPNLASTGAIEVRRSVEALAEDMARCRMLGVNYLVVHVGRAGVASAEEALPAVAANINRVFEQSPGPVKLLLENTAGMGSEVGYRFDQVAAVIERVEDRDRVGIVLDTAHLFEAGYELRTASGLDETLREFDREVGFGRLHMLHLNDSKTGLGFRVDRHWHIGKGEIGTEAFRRIVNHPLLRHLPGIMETPRKSREDDRENMNVIRSLAN